MSKDTSNKDDKAKDIQDNSNKKVCFVVMPISDQEGYEKGHFDRVYKHLIAPAIIAAGLEPQRADEEQVTNDIRLDIIKKILESDHVICDLSARNPNVFYELGMRQAFDKSITLIKDNKTPRVFDVAGIRTINYDENLRVDNIDPKITEIANSIEKTLAHTETSPFDNSIIRQLGITAAKPAETTEISTDTQVILKQLQYLNSRLDSQQAMTDYSINRSNHGNNASRGVIIRDQLFSTGGLLKKGNKTLGEIWGIDPGSKIITYKVQNKNLLTNIPFDTIIDNEDYHYDDDVPF